MKKTVIAIVVMILLCAMLTGCGSPTYSTKLTGNRAYAGQDIQTYHYAYVWLGDKIMVEGYITQWRDYDESDVIQLMIDGKYYLTHYSNVLMVADPAKGGMGYDSGWVDHN